MCGREKETHYLIELIHLGKHRELLASFEDLFVLRSMRLLCEWVQIMFLHKHLSQSTSPKSRTYHCPANLISGDISRKKPKERLLRGRSGT
jgi:hypothetical protein